MDKDEIITKLSGEIIGAVLEHNAKIKQTNEISDRIRNYINELGDNIKTYILEHSLNQYQGKIDWYYEEYSQIIIKHLEGIDAADVTGRKLNELIKKNR